MGLNGPFIHREMTCLKWATRAAPGTAVAVTCVTRVCLPCCFDGESRALRRGGALKRPLFGPFWACLAVPVAARGRAPHRALA